MNSSHHNTVMRTDTPKTVNVDANTARADSQPCMSFTLGVATWPETSFVTAMLAPVSINNVPSVIKKLGILVFITRYPLKNPIASARINANPAPAHRFRCKL